MGAGCRADNHGNVHRLLARLAVVLLLLACWLLVSSMVRESPTVDEQSHLFRGAAYLVAGATHFELGHPLLSSALAAVPLLTEPDLQLPLDSSYWSDGDWTLSGDAFLWRINQNPQRLLFLGRLPVVWLTLLLAALTYRWGRELGDELVGFGALALLALDPNVLAHGRLITGDLPMTAFFVLAVYGFWRWSQNGSPSSLLLCGLGLGFAAASKYNALLILPVLAVLAGILAVDRRSWRPLGAAVVAAGIGWVAVWAVYGFELRPLPGGAFWDDLAWLLKYLPKPHGAYLAGHYSTTGWWYYFPIAFVAKTPWPTMFVAGCAIALVVRDRWLAFRALGEGEARPPGWAVSLAAGLPHLSLVLPVLAYSAASLFSNLNIGYRHLLPLLPFLALLSAAWLVSPRVGGSRARGLAVGTGSIALLCLITLVAWPHFLAYFNWPIQGWRLLSDSNVDWGQDLPALVDWQRSTGERVKLSYFGTAHPSAYGVEFDALPTWSPGAEQSPPSRQAFDPDDPAPGWYAISVTNLHGMVLGDDRDTFAWFRQIEPQESLGGSIFLYYVEPRGDAADVAFSGLRPGDIVPQLAAEWDTNDVRPRWFDASASLIWPANGGWLAVAVDQTPDALLEPWWPVGPHREAAGQLVLSVDAAPAFDWPGVDTDVGGILTFRGYRRLDAPSGRVTMLTAWEVQQATERPLQIFVHALGGDGQIVGQWDGLDVDPTSWRPGDVFVQLHRFSWEDASPQRALVVGVYDGATLDRLSGSVLVRCCARTLYPLQGPRATETLSKMKGWAYRIESSRCGCACLR